MAAAPPPSREACAIVLDASASNKDFLSVSKSVCSALIQQKFIFAPRDLVGVIIGGTDTTANRLNAAAPGHYEHLSAVRPVMAPNADFLKAVDAAVCATDPAHVFDMLDAIVVAADAIHEAVQEKKFSRRIFLVSSCSGAVKRKEQLATIVDGLKARGIALVVIGVNFDEDEDESGTGDVEWSTLTLKQQNEKVLHFMCAQLGGESLVVAVSDAVSALGALRKKHIAQRAYCKCVIDIGEVRIPLALYTKATEHRVPTMGKLSKTGEGVVIDRRYFSIRRPDDELEATDRVKAYRYGRSAIPITDVDAAQMKFTSVRSMSALGFVPIDQVPLHILQGGSKLMVPVAGDTIGAGALAAFVRAMASLRRAMLVRLVRCTNANPVLGVAFPSAKGDKDSLYFNALPYAEDLRHFSFRHFDEVKGTEDERQSIAAMIDAMDLDRFEQSGASAAAAAAPSPAGTPSAAAAAAGASASSSEDAAGGVEKLLSIKETFNPALQHYYHAVKERYLRPDAPVAGLPPQVAKTATAWGDPGSVLHPFLASSQQQRKRVRDLLPLATPATAGGAAGNKPGKTYWFQKAGEVQVAGGASGQGGPSHRTEGAGGGAPGQYLGTGTPATTTGVNTGTPHQLSGAAPSPADMDSAIRVSGETGDAFAMHVSTVDPVGTFWALINRKGEDHVGRALHEIQEAVLQLLKVSIGAQHYGRCADAVRAMRQACVREGEPGVFNTFLVHLMLSTRNEAHHTFWTDEVLKGGIAPISQAECPESDLTTDAARTFFEDRAPVAKVVVDEEPDEPSLFDELE